MKWIFIMANVLAAIVFECLGAVAVSAHVTHAYSVYHELQVRHVLVERADYNVEKRLRTIAAGGAYYEWLSHLAAGACLVNAVAIGALSRRQPKRAGEPARR